MSYCSGTEYQVNIRTFQDVNEVKRYLDRNNLCYFDWTVRHPVHVTNGVEHKLRDDIGFSIRFRNCDEIQEFLKYMKTLDASTTVFDIDNHMWISYDYFLAKMRPVKYGKYRFTRRVA